MDVIITDICCELSKDFCEKHNIKVIGMIYTIDGTDYIQTLENADLKSFYQKMREGAMPSTSQINTAEFIEFFTPILQEGNDIIYTALSSGLSGTYTCAVNAAAQLKEQFPERKISIIDSLSVSMGEGLFVYNLAELRDAGKSHEEIVEAAEAQKLFVNHWFTVDDLHHLYRGGRVSGTAAVVGTILGIKPVLHNNDEGKLVPVEKKKGRKRALQGLFERLDTQGKNINGQKIFISHGDCLEDAEYVISLIKEKYPKCTFEIGFIGPVVGSHSGPGTVALFFMGTQR